MSINFSSKGKCDLNSVDHTQKPDDLTEVIDTIYSSIEVSATFLLALNYFSKLIKTRKSYKTSLETTSCQMNFED